MGKVLSVFSALRDTIFHPLGRALELSQRRKENRSDEKSARLNSSGRVDGGVWRDAKAIKI